MRIVAIIPVKEISERVSKKNFRNFYKPWNNQNYNKYKYEQLEL